MKKLILLSILLIIGCEAESTSIESSSIEESGILGLWEREIKDVPIECATNDFIANLVFTNNGWLFTPENGSSLNGTYIIDENLIVILDNDSESTCHDLEGEYIFSIYNQYLTLTSIKDDCQCRDDMFNGAWMIK